MIAIILSMIKLGMYFPAPHAPLGTWFYASVPLFQAAGGWSVSAGYSNEPVLRASTILGHNVRETFGKNAYFLSGTKATNEDLDFDLGVKHLDGLTSPFISASFKFGSLMGRKGGRRTWQSR